MNRESWVNLILLAGLIVIPVGAEMLGQPFTITLATRVVVLATAGVGLNLALGYGGMVSFGHAAFFGLGGYAAGVLASHALNQEVLINWPAQIPGTTEMLVIWPVAMLVSALAALAIGALSLRTSGVYFIMITLAFAQMVYYFYAWGRVSGGDPTCRLSFSVPTGNFGDVFAGHMAKRMGLPVDRLVIATNRNDILSRFVNTGAYTAGKVHPTLSPAMDIQIASNFERYLYYLVGEDPEAVRALLNEMGRTGSMRVTDAWRAAVAGDFDAVATDDAQTLAQIRETYERVGYVLDPHTAVGVRAARGRGDPICLATAHPAKFNEAVRQAIGKEAPPPPSLQGLMEKETRCALLDATEDAVRGHIRDTLAAVGT